MNDDLNSKTQEEISVLFAVECLFYEKRHHWYIPPNTALWLAPRDLRFAKDADAILPYLEKAQAVRIERDAVHDDHPVGWSVDVTFNEDDVYPEWFTVNFSRAPTVAQAACMALIRAKRYDPLKVFPC